MKRKRAFMPLIFIMGLVTTSCNAFEKDLNVVVLNITNPSAPEENWTYEQVYQTKVNIFNSAILPINSVTVPGKKFIGYGAKDFEKGVSKKKDFIKGKGLVRYNNVKQYAVNGTVTLKATYVLEEDVPTQYIVFGWYGKTDTSGLNEEKMIAFENMLRAHIGSSVSYNEIEVREYFGDVATIGADITFDEDVDIFLGAGVNLGTTGGVSYVARNGYTIAGAADRYIYRLNNRTETKEIYDWVRTDEVRNFFSGE